MEGKHTRIHIAIAIDYLLKQALEGKQDLLTDVKTGKTLTCKETINFLCKYKAKGMQYLVSSDCNNRRKDGSCKGHLIKKKDVKK